MNVLLTILFSISCVSSIGQMITTVAGNGTYGYSGNGGLATSAQLAWQCGVITDKSGNFYIADHDNNVVRKVNSAGIIINFAGNGTLGYSGDGGLATAAQLYHPTWMGFDNLGNLYIIDQNGNSIRKVDNITGIITSITGNLQPGYSGDGGPVAAAQFTSIAGITFDAAGNMYISDNGNHVIRKVNTLGIVTTIVGTGTPGFSGDGGPASAAQLGSPYKVAFDNIGNMYIPDNGYSRIRKVNTAGIISTFAGSGNFGYAGDGGQAVAADFQYPWTIDIDNSGNLYIGDAGANVVRKVAPNGIITTYAGNGTYGYTGDGGLATAAEIGTISSISVDPGGNLFISVREYFNVIRKVTNCLTASIIQQPVTVNLCNAGNAIFTVNATNATGYQWQMNSGTGWNNLSSNSIYSGTLTDSLKITGASTSMNNFQYRCVLSNGCGSIFSSPASLLVNAPAIPAIVITTPTTDICMGTTVLFSATVQNEGPSPMYQWKKNGINVGANSNSYSDNTLATGDIVSCTLLSNAACVTGNAASSNSIVMSVTNPLTPGITIVGSANNICFGTPITFSASVINGGDAPVLTWYKNGIVQSINSPTYTDNLLLNGDTIICSVTSSLSCVPYSSAISLPIVMSVTQPVSPVVTITASANAICRNTTVTYTASSLNAGNSPIFQWKKNGIQVGVNSNTYLDSTLVHGDVISCVLTSNATCVSTKQVTSNSLPITVYSDPIVILDKNSSLCEGSSRTLNAGAFSTYRWNTGSNDRSITIDKIGLYSVTVTDNNGCTGTDSVNISTLLPSPKDFLPKDTSICSYGDISLRPTTTYRSYQWSTGSNSNSITITQSGQYWLQVRNNDGCSGSDTIHVEPKECLKGFFMPDAFTPNNDGKNDRIKPILLGNVKQYHFSIYNRWGQLVFQTTDIFKAWDGNFMGAKQSGNVFVWLCTYQFENEPTQNKKGTIVMIR